MKKSILLFIIAVLSAAAGNISVTVNHISGKHGKLYVGLYNKPEGFARKSKVYRSKILPVRSGSVTCRFRHIPDGIYAVSVFHDTNGNGRLDTNLFGKPTEGYGFSRNARHLFRSPTFRESQFRLKRTASVTIRLGY